MTMAFMNLNILQTRLNADRNTAILELAPGTLISNLGEHWGHLFEGALNRGGGGLI